MAWGCVKNLFIALRAKFKFERGCVKRFSPPAAAKYSLDGDIFFLILRSKIRKKMSPSKFNLARSAKKNLFTQPQYLWLQERF